MERGIEEKECSRAVEEGYDDGVAQPRDMNMGSVRKAKIREATVEP